MNSVLNLPDGQGSDFLGGNSNYRRTVINDCSSIFFRLVGMTFGLVHARYSSPKWQAVKLTFFAPILRHQPQRALVLKKRADTGSLNLACRPFLSRRAGREILE